MSVHRYTTIILKHVRDGCSESNGLSVETPAVVEGILHEDPPPVFGKAEPNKAEAGVP